jgi:hypothetical protein
MATEVVQGGPPAPEVLIREARHHQRRRYGVVAGLILLAVLALVIGIVAGGIIGFSSTPGPVSGAFLSGPALSATSASRVAAVTLIDQYTFPGCRRSDTTSTGSIDFANGAISLTTKSSRGVPGVCASQLGDQVRQFGSDRYQKIVPPFCHPTPCSINPAAAPPAGKPWAETSLTSYPSSSSEVVQLLATPYALVALKAFPASTTERNATLRGVPMHVYSTRVSLARLERIIKETTGVTHHALATFGSPHGALPPPNTIPISLHAWIDSSGRVVRLSMTQPSYTVNFKSGASEGGDELVPSQYSAGEVPSDYPYKTGYTKLTITFSRFGAARSPIKPSPQTTFHPPF